MAEIKSQEAQHGRCDSSSEEHERVQSFAPIRLVKEIMRLKHWKTTNKQIKWRSWLCPQYIG